MARPLRGRAPGAGHSRRPRFGPPTFHPSNPWTGLFHCPSASGEPQNGEGRRAGPGHSACQRIPDPGEAEPTEVGRVPCREFRHAVVAKDAGKPGIENTAECERAARGMGPDLLHDAAAGDKIDDPPSRVGAKPLHHLHGIGGRQGGPGDGRIAQPAGETETMYSSPLRTSSASEISSRSERPLLALYNSSGNWIIVRVTHISYVISKRCQHGTWKDARVLGEAEFLRPHSAHGGAEETERDNTKKRRAERRTDRIAGWTGWGCGGSHSRDPGLRVAGGPSYARPERKRSEAYPPGLAVARPSRTRKTPRPGRPRVSCGGAKELAQAGLRVHGIPA